MLLLQGYKDPAPVGRRSVDGLGHIADQKHAAHNAGGGWYTFCVLRYLCHCKECGMGLTVSHTRP